MESDILPALILLFSNIILFLYSFFISYRRGFIKKCILFYSVVFTIIFVALFLDMRYGFTVENKKWGGLIIILIAPFFILFCQLIFIIYLLIKVKKDPSVDIKRKNFIKFIYNSFKKIGTAIIQELTLNYPSYSSELILTEEQDIWDEKSIEKTIENTFKYLNIFILKKIQLTEEPIGQNELKYSIETNNSTYIKFVDKAEELLKRIAEAKSLLIESDLQRENFNRNYERNINLYLKLADYNWTENFKKPSIVQVLQKAVSPLYFPISLFFILSRYLDVQGFSLPGYWKHVSMGFLVAVIAHLFISTSKKSKIEIERSKNRTIEKGKFQIINKLQPLKSLLLN